MNTYMIAKQLLLVTYSMISTSILHKLRLTDYKTPRALYSLIRTVYIICIPTIQHTHLPPNIHNRLSITIYASTNHPIKTHHNSKTSKDKHIFICTMSMWDKPKHTTFTASVWGESGWGYHDHVKVPVYPPLLKIQSPPSLEVSTCPTKESHESKWNHTVWYPPFIKPSYHWNVAFQYRT